MDTTKITSAKLIMLVVAVFMLTGVDGLTCYNCDSANQPNCAVSFKFASDSPSESNCICCRKYSKGDAVVRECYKQNPFVANACETKMGNYACKEDYCNAANRDATRTVINVALLSSVISSVLAAW